MLLRQKDDASGSGAADNNGAADDSAAAENGAISAPPLGPFSSRGARGPSKPPTKAPAIAAAAPHWATEISTTLGVGRADSKTLIVGRDIRLAGEITECDRLIVEGHVEVALSDARLIEVADKGHFKGSADVVDADISGLFEGELTAKNKLTVRAGGRVGGTIRYGSIVIEAGGEVSGDMQALAPVPEAGDADEA